MSDNVPARCSCFHVVLPVSAAIAQTVPTLSAPMANSDFMLMPYTFEGSRWSVVVVAVMQRFCSGMYIMFVRGLYAPAGQFLPPLLPGQTKRSSFSFVKTTSGLTITLPVVGSMLLITFCCTVGRAQRNSPVCRSSV